MPPRLALAACVVAQAAAVSRCLRLRESLCGQHRFASPRMRFHAVTCPSSHAVRTDRLRVWAV